MAKQSGAFTEQRGIELCRIQGAVSCGSLVFGQLVDQSDDRAHVRGLDTPDEPIWFAHPRSVAQRR